MSFLITESIDVLLIPVTLPEKLQKALIFIGPAKHSFMIEETFDHSKLHH